MKTTKIILGAALFLGTLTSCEKDEWFCIEGNGDIDTEYRSVTSFTKVELDFDAEVYISQGSNREVRIVASDNLFDYIETDVKGSKLSLDVQGGRCIDEDHGDIKIYITNPDYTALEISGSGEIKNHTPLNLNDLDIDVNGSGDVELDGLNLDDYEIRISGSGEVTLSGSNADNGVIDVSGSGDVDLSDLTTDDVTIDISGSGNVEVDVVNQLNADITGSGDVKYSGNPSMNTNITGSGSIKKN